MTAHLDTTSSAAAHAREAADVARGLGVDPLEGLPPESAAARLSADGPNELPRPRRRGDLTLALGQLRSPLVLILIASGLVTLAIGQVVDASVILAVVVLNAVIGVIQEGRAERALHALTSLTESSATVLRGGRLRSVPARELVRGDVVALAAGDRVPADLRLVSARELRADESALTGESLAVSKRIAPVAPGTGLGDRTCMAWAGTLVVAGEARGVVVATGLRTQIGRIQELVAQVEDLDTPLTRQIAGFSRVLGIAILGLAALTFAVGAARSQGIGDALVAAVALAVGAIPESLPAAVTISLALGVSRMARRRAVVRRLPAVETLGSTTAILTDKTGTLTRNDMVVRTILTGGRGTRLPEPGAPADLSSLSRADLETLRVGLLASDAHVHEHDGRIEAVGDPTEAAIVMGGRACGLDPAAERMRRPRLDSLPFSSERGLMATLHAEPGGGRMVYVKGSPERVVALCEAELAADGSTRALHPGAAREQARALAGEGLRVLAMARGRADEERPLSQGPPEGLVLVGMLAMLDPPRESAAPAVHESQQAGIAVKMVTGDHARTAAAIAEEVGLGSHRHPRVTTGSEIDEAPSGAIDGMAAQGDVFARVSPEHKLELVRALQRRGEVVAVTGDGVNDAPALRQADIGVAMGAAGTDAAKQVSDLVLLDDDFATVTAAVEEGRRVFDNITKFIAWTLPTNLGEGLVILVAVLLGLTLPITPVQILWINMTTAVALGLPLAFEPAEPGLMTRPPRTPGRPILTGELVTRIVLVAGVLLAGSFAVLEWATASGATLDQARTLAMNTFVAGEVAYLFNCRTLSASARPARGNPWVWVGIAATLGLQAVLTYAPPLQAAFGTAPMGVAWWLAPAAIGVCVFLAVGLAKRVQERRVRPR